jgi:choline dehydrogenase
MAAGCVRLGVEPIRHLRGVGFNLQDHLQLRSIYQIEGIRSLNGLANSRFGQSSPAGDAS